MGKKTFSELLVSRTVISPILSQETIELVTALAKGEFEVNLWGDGERNLREQLAQTAANHNVPGENLQGIKLVKYVTYRHISSEDKS